MLLTISCMTRKALLLVAGFYTPISDLWESPLQYSVCVSNFSTYLYQIILSLCGKPYSGREGKHAVILVTNWFLDRTRLRVRRTRLEVIRQDWK